MVFERGDAEALPAGDRQARGAPIDFIADAKAAEVW
jgi:hypothetical protein